MHTTSADADNSKVTGDFKLTALAIAHKCSIITRAPSDVHVFTALSSDETKQDLNMFKHIGSCTSLVLSGAGADHTEKNNGNSSANMMRLASRVPLQNRSLR